MSESEVKRSGPSIIIVIFIASSMLLSSCGSLSFSSSLFPTVTGTTPLDLIDEAPDPMIRLRFANFDPLVYEPSIPSLLKAPEYQSYVEAPCIVQSKGKVTEEWKAELRDAGAEIVGYIPDNALLVRMDQKSQDSVFQLNSVRWFGNYEPAYKVSPDLNGLSGLVTFDISFFIEGTNGPTVRFLRDNGAEFIDIANNDKVNKLIVRADASLIDEIASFPDVKWISQYQEPVTCNNSSTQLHQSGSTIGGRVIADDPWDLIPGRQINGDLKNDGAGFGDGDRKVVAVSDSGIRTTHEVWSEPGKVIDNYVPDGSSAELGVDPIDPGEHGQATASMVCGDAPTWVDYTTGAGDQKDGAAFGARIIFQDIGMNFPDPYIYPPPDYYHDLFEDAQHGDVANGHIGGASVHSCCWGGGNGYSDECAQIDEYVWDNKDYVTCWVVGGDGPGGSTINSQAEAKNCIGVGATTEVGTAVASFSSRGPTVPDGRIKPDLVAVGVGITTANNAGDTTYWADNWSGTSAATAYLAGHAALVQQYFEDGWGQTGIQTNDNGFTPSAALVKATMINGASPIGTIPNMDEGWGRIHLENSLYFQGDTRVVRYIDYGYQQPGSTEGAGLCTGDFIEYTFDVTSAAQPFRVSMVYSDYKGDPSAGIMLVNDLDLIVTGPSGTFYGNNFAGGFSQTGVYDDNLNNIECVYVQTPIVGAYTIRIDAENIPIGPQDFALVISGGLPDGYGIVTTDRVTYTVSDTINIVVEDNNNLAGTVDVTVTSSGSGDTETVTLTSIGPGTGIFTGSINTIFGITLPDGVLQVVNGDTVTVTYSDADPVHDSIATASILTFGPVITNVRVEDIMGTSAVVKWDTDIPSNSTAYFGTGSDSALWTDVQGNEDYTTAHVLPLMGLTTETFYYFDVASSTTRGATSRDDYGGSHYAFSTTGLASGPMVFFVDDDDGAVASDGTPFNEDWENSLNAFGWTYTRWDIAVMGTPTQADMEQAKVVMWVVSEGYPQISATDRDALDDYLEFSPDPKLFVVGQDIGWDMNPGGTDPDQAWYEKHLHAIFEGDDADGGSGDEGASFIVYGIAGDPISGDYTGGIPLGQGVYGAGRFWPDDISNNGGTICWDYNRHTYGGNAAGIRADEVQTNAHTGYPGYRLVYEAWAHEMMGTWNPPIVDPIRSDVLDKSLIWLLGADHPEVTLTYPTGGEVLTGTESITWSSVGSLNTKVFYSQNNGQAWNLLYEDPTGLATTYDWDTTLTDDGIAYKVKVLVTGTADLTDYKTSAAFEIDNGIDNTGPAVVAGSVKVDPQPTYSPAPATLTATLTDMGRGGSNIVAAQYRIDGGSSSPMNPADVFDSSIEDVIATVSSGLTNGDHLVEVRGQDAIGNWGTWSSFIWHVVNPDPPPSVTVLDNNGQGEDGTWSGMQTITWIPATDNNPLPPNPITIYYSDDAGGSWNLIAANEVNDGAYFWDTTVVLDGADYMIKVECVDDVPQIGFDISDATFYIDNVEDFPVVDVTRPDGGEFFQIGQVETITWTATDADPGDVITIDIEYCNDWPTPTWIPIASGEVNDGLYPWTVPDDYTTTARVRITGTDTTVQSTSDISDGDFEIGREYFLQVQSPFAGYKNLNPDPLEATIQTVDTGDITGPGQYKVGSGADDNWVSEIYPTSKDLGGTWEFKMYGQVSSDLAAGFLYAKVYQHSDNSLLFTTGLDNEDVQAFVGADHEFVWTYNVAGGITLDANDRFYVEVWLDATAGGGGSWTLTYVPTDAGYTAECWELDGTPPTGGNINNQYAMTEASVSVDDGTRWSSVDPGVGDEMFIWSEVTVSPDPATITQIDMTFNGQGNAATNFDLWVLGSAGWAATGDTIACAAGIDGTLTGTITVTPGDYIIGGVLTWGAYQTDNSDLVRIDFLETAISSVIPPPVFTLSYDEASTPSSVWPILTIGSPPVPFDIDVSMAGASNWVFVSFPITVTGDVLTVFDDAFWGGGGTTDWDMIYWYDPLDTADHWKSYNINYPGTQDMPNVYNSMGMWVHLTANDGFLTIGEGQDPYSTTINLVTGWNLVGFPSQVEGYTAGDLKTDSGGLVTSIERFNDAVVYDIEVMPDGDSFLIGQAYWIYTTAAYAWFIP